ncbi:hypothetical protein NBRC10512_002495 [Rhodotorula toruloides]|uniref:RHTO0S18e03246g1_1 n=2 Tax=Rhodotorula toruloides TaxID=5286 RepID=A0A061BF72_RHOTO|nr:uncharacterized protein RHTO_06495 [Rhodotorula toruloides NP11]EMS18270.1 hypothetical protein RHTO_06495 [Rhodotorula toruloides NP11]CDR48580.1 RHTO0S18e03246g1_1 [Rhodotorula toruloides]
MYGSSHPYAQQEQRPSQPAHPFPTGPSTHNARMRPRQPPPEAPLPAPPKSKLPALPSAVPPSPRHASERLASSSTSPALAYPSFANDPFPSAQQRIRGESSPALSRHSTRDPFDDVTFDAQGRPVVTMRRQDSGGGTVTKRFVVGEDGREREETREERRARKERERAERGQSTVSEMDHRRTSSRTSRTSDGYGFGTTPLTSPPIPSPSASPRLASPPPNASSSNSSKSVLTVALQRAQSAVLLDSANNFPAAIAAYTQAVRLLKDVMARVEDGSKEMERKLSTGGVREGETVEEYEKRRARYERKERAKVDEARRLRVIHDTYEDRIRMLVSMGTPLPPGAASPPTPSQRTLSASSSLHSLAEPKPYTPSVASNSTVTSAAPPMTYRRRRSSNALEQHARQRSVTSLHTVTTPPTSVDAGSSYIDFDRPATGRAGAGVAESIGSAMMADVASPTSPKPPPWERGVPQIGDLPVFSSLADSVSPTLTRDEGFLSAASPTARDARPLSYASDSTATAIARTPNTATPVPAPSPSAPPSILPPPIPSSTSDPSSLAAPLSPGYVSSSGETDDLPMHTAIEPGSGWPAQSPQNTRAALPTDAPIPSPDDRPLPLHASSSESSVPGLAHLAPFMRRGSSASALTAASGETLRIGYGPGGEQMRRGSSAGTLPMRRGSSFGGLAFTDGEGSPVEIRPRPVRGASLIGTAHAPTLSSIAQAKAPLVNPTTAEGTISQRRNLRSPQPDEQSGLRPSTPSDLGAPSANIVVRAPSSEIERTPPPPVPYAFPSGSHSHHQPNGSISKGSGFSGASLPSRLRSLSQSGSKRPKLQSFDSEQGRPPLPPLRTTVNHTSSVSVSSAATSSTGGPSRKASVPTPTSLNAPTFATLGRSNSSSSVANNASSAYPFRTLASAGSEGPPSSARSRHAVSPSFSAYQHHPSQSVSGGVYLSAGLPSPPASTEPASRETTLAVPAARRPFHLMRLVLATMPPPPNANGASSGGGYLSERLYVPAQVWTTQGGAKLVALETKVRMLELISTGLDALEKAGRGLLLVPTASSSAHAAAREEAARFARELESFEGLAEGVQTTLNKKLGPGVIGSFSGGVSGGAGAGPEKDAKTGRKGSTASFSTWSSKLSASLNRVTNGVSLDSQAAYVDAIAKVFRQGQCLDPHLAFIFASGPADAVNPEDSPYALLPDADRHRLERQLRKSSEFFNQVVCRFVLRDVGVLLDKYVKRGGAWLSGE